MFHRSFSLWLALALGFLAPTLGAASSLSDSRWWPEQKTPSSLAIVDSRDLSKMGAGHEEEIYRDPIRGPYQMLAASLGGLMAQAVNEDRGSELLWFSVRGNAAYAEWLKRLVKRTGVTTRKSPDLWELVREQAENGVVKGYILYNHERVSLEERKDGPRNESANAATAMAGLLGGVVVDEQLREEAEKVGLKMLLDARKLTEKEVFAQHRDAFNRHCVMLQSPEKGFGRDLAIAHRMMVLFGRETPTPEVYAWMEPIGTVFGWNLDPEDKAVGQVSEAGHIIIPCDWAPNLPALSCGSPASLEGFLGPKFRPPSPVPVAADRSAVGVVMSDGDNLQWLLTTFTHNPRFWANPRRNDFPIGWGLPTGDLLQMSPDTYNYLVETQGDKTSILLHLGYYYPDTFGILRGPEKRKELLARLARRVQLTLAASGTSLFTFLAIDPQSAAAREAYEIFAREIPALGAMFAIQYHPYEGGRGAILWAEGMQGRQIPVTTAAYAIWKASDKRERAQVAEQLAKTVQDAAAEANRAAKPFSDWVIVHVWSEFSTPGGQPGEMIQGVDPVVNFSRLVDREVPVITAEQIVERLQPNQPEASGTRK